MRLEHFSEKDFALQNFPHLNDNADDRSVKVENGGAMKVFAFVVLALVLMTGGFSPRPTFGQDRVRIGVPLFPPVSYPVFIAQERGFFEKNGVKDELIRIHRQTDTYPALISGNID